MHLRSILSGTLAVLLATGGATLASGTAPAQPTDGGFSLRLPKFELPGVFGSKPSGETGRGEVRMAQASDTNALAEEIRSLNGKIEELNFQILQMQEQIRKTQEDNEFRFQQLEQGGTAGGQQKKSDASGGGASPAQTQAQTQAQASAAGDDATASTQAGQAAPTIGDIIVDSGDGEPGKLIPGTPPKSLGAITVDKNGNVVNAEPTAPPASGTGTASGTGGGQGAVVASLPPAQSAEELYRNSYQFILSGDYGTAEQGFRDHIARYPKDAKAADAHYWLGEALLGQQKYRDAAEVFLAASKDYPKAKKAPDMLLKLGISLVGLNQRDVACATFGEIGKRYPQASVALKDRVKQERALAAC